MSKRRHTSTNDPWEALEAIANEPTTGRWSVDRVQGLRLALKLAIRHAREDVDAKERGVRRVRT